MHFRTGIVFGILTLSAKARSTCPEVNLLSARTVNLTPSSTSHINLLRQNDGSYTGYEVADSAPFRVIKTTPHFETQFAACLPRNLPASPAAAAPALNQPGAASQLQVSEPLLSGNYYTASITPSQSTITLDTFDRQLDLISETSFAAPNPGEMFLTLKLADLNGDGAPDLIALSERPIGVGYFSLSLSTFFSVGDGVFQAARRQDLIGNDVGALVGPIAVADLNGDGKEDVVVLLNGLGVQSLALLGNGDGTFRQQNLPLILMNNSGYALPFAIADLNGDGKPDLVLIGGFTVTYLATVAVALGNGDGTFQALSLFPIQPTTPNSAIAVGDVNDDGFLDIVTSSGSILFGDGKGGFPTRRDYALSATGFVMLADFDGDGKTDILIGAGNPAFLSGSSNYPSLTVLFGQGGGAFAAAPVSFAGVGGIDFTGESMAIADFDGDGIPDLVLADSTDGFAAVLTGKGNGEFSSVFRTNFQHAPVSLAVADFNRDGKPDVAVLLDLSPNPGGEVQVFLGNGDGTLAASLVLPAPGTNMSFIGARI